MPVPLPQLDNQNYESLMNEARALIPTYAPSWTNHNPSDPGITLIELFAYLTELLLYRINRITPANMEAFLKLLNGPDWHLGKKTLEEEVRNAVQTIRTVDRAVTKEDFTTLAKKAGNGQIARAVCVPRYDLESGNPAERPGHISVIILPKNLHSNPYPSQDLIREVQEYLEPRRLLGTWLHVVAPRYLKLGVRLTLISKSGISPERVQREALNTLVDFFHPLNGGPEKNGWPLGRPVYVSEIYRLLNRSYGVDHVTKTLDQETGNLLDELSLNLMEGERIRKNDQGEMVAVDLYAGELIDAQIRSKDVIVY